MNNNKKTPRSDQSDDQTLFGDPITAPLTLQNRVFLQAR